MPTEFLFFKFSTIKNNDVFWLIAKNLFMSLRTIIGLLIHQGNFTDFLKISSKSQVQIVLEINGNSCW
jgi:hypothetical protein